MLKLQMQRWRGCWIVCRSKHGGLTKGEGEGFGLGACDQLADAEAKGLPEAAWEGRADGVDDRDGESSGMQRVMS